MRRGWITALAASAVALVAPAAASAASVAYIDGGNIWVSSLDGAQKHQLTTDGEWDEVAQSDNGRIVGVRRDDSAGAKISPINTMRVWEANGAPAFQGALRTRDNWFSSLFPLSLDMNADGSMIAYGYRNTSLGYTSSEIGAYLLTATTVQLTVPISVVDAMWPTFAGKRLVANWGGQVAVQKAEVAPAGTEFDPWLVPIPGYDLGRTDVSANGRIAALEMNKYDYTITQTAGFIDMTPVNGLSGEVLPGSCIMPSQGFAEDVSLSQDGTRVAWADQGGVWVAGVPGFLGNGPPASVPAGNSLCVLTSPPVLISATAKYPSIGGANVADMLPAPGGTAPTSPTAPGGTSPTAPGGSTPTVLSVTLPASTAIAALRKGLAVRVGAPRAGLVSVTATVPGKRLGLRGAAARRPALIAKGTARVAAARVIAVKLKLTALGRAKSGRLKGAKATVRIKLGTKVLTRTLRLR